MTFVTQSSPRSRQRSIWRTVGFGLVLTLGIAVYHYQYFLDEYALATYHAPANVAALTAPLGLTRSAQAIFDRSRPEIDDKATFNVNCQTEQGDLELGCYSNGRIYVLEIDNPSLKPEMETVLAHELMHAVWARLGSSERATLGTELEAIYHGLNDSDLSDRMASYATSEPGEETNELHSILGTEEATLTPQLEAHYSRYFERRSAIVAAHMAYKGVFTSQGDALAAQLATIKSLKGQLAVLNAQMERFRAANQIVSYNALVPRQNALVDQINGLISAYDTAVDEYNALSKSIDSHAVTPTEPGV